eukprot:CAMPEP_0115440898 /NCGR_PEP_ID=MMETSP0271-20121206/36537_1 /TAXON_ID=71861 /ORGANISM="Scrippsiella trochoidea, Strain CCMP3099" /LENGTH=39 /DNA_ID= /DNA_START= /DNA_END= /DNA_ORIENTATION=
MTDRVVPESTCGDATVVCGTAGVTYCGAAVRTVWPGAAA